MSSPRGLLGRLAIVATLCGVPLALLVATLVRDRGAVRVSAETLAAVPALASPGFRFDRDELRARAGEAVALRLENPDGIPHSFDIDEFGVHVAMPRGEPALALFTPTRAGTYTFYCRVPGHREQGMVGTLTVAP